MTDTPSTTPPPAPLSMPSQTAVGRTSLWRRPWLPYLVLAIVGLVVGFGVAVREIGSGALGDGERIGAWQTARDFGTADQGARDRAVVAAHGLLALPASEARYYTATVDDAGQPLLAACTYRLTGGLLPTQFWTVTLYDRAGYLVANAAGRYSVGSMTLAAAEQRGWTIIVSPKQQPGHWLPTGGEAGTAGDPIALTLRAYLPADGGKGDFTAAQLPSIRKEGCA